MVVIKDVPFTEVGCVSDEIEHFQRHKNQLLPGISMDRLQKTHVREIQSYVSWKKKHCKEEHYTLQIKKCMDPHCCIPTKLNQEELEWLPMPFLDWSGLHYLPYDEANRLKKADERDRPSLKIRKETQQPKNAYCLRASQVLSIHAEHFFYFRLIQSLRQQVLCVYAPHSSVQCKLKFFIMDRMLAELINAAIVEGTNAVVSQELKQRFKTVLPMCKPSLDN